MADTYTRQVNNTVRGIGSGTGIAYRYYPALAGAGATGVALTVAGGPAWSAVTAVLAASTITTEFWFCRHGGLYTASGAVSLKSSGITPRSRPQSILPR